MLRTDFHTSKNPYLGLTISGAYILIIILQEGELNPKIPLQELAPLLHQLQGNAYNCIYIWYVLP